jgi:hypothetical protein
MAFGSFTPEHLRQLDEREISFEQLERLGNVWISPDIEVEKPVVIPPQRVVHGVNIVLRKEDLPSIDITRGALGSLAWSMRSFLAQSGIEIRFDRSYVSDTMLSDINDGKDVLVPVIVENLGQRAVELKGTVMRFFWVNDSKRLRRKELLDVIKSGEFSVDGVEGEDWFLGGYDPEEKIMTDGEASDKGLCVVLRLEPQKFYIPPAEEPVRIENSRKDLPKFLRPIPEGAELNFEIGETPKVKLGQNIVAVINTGAEKGQRHIYSPLIDPGSEGHIRTETLYGTEYVEFFLYRK